MKIARTIVALGAAASMSIGMFAVPAVAQEDSGLDATVAVDIDLEILEGAGASDLVGEVLTALDDVVYTVVSPADVAGEAITEIFRYSYWINDTTGDIQTDQPEDETGWSEDTAWLAVYNGNQVVDVTAYVEEQVQPGAGVVSLTVVIEAGYQTPDDESTQAGTWVRIYAANENGEPTGAALDEFFIPDEDDENGTPGGGTNAAASAALFDITASSGDSTPQCAAAVATVGIPLLLLPPLALSSQLGFVGLSEITAGLEAQVQDFNTQIQQGTGIFDPETARLIEQVNNALAPYGVNAGQVVGATGLLVVGGLAANHILSNCL